MPKRYIPALIIFIALLASAIYSYQLESSFISAMVETTRTPILVENQNSCVVVRCFPSTSAIADMETPCLLRSAKIYLYSEVSC